MQTDISLRTGLTYVRDFVCKWQSSVFCYVAKLPASIPAHQAFKLQTTSFSKTFQGPTGSPPQLSAWAVGRPTTE